MQAFALASKLAFAYCFFGGIRCTGMCKCRGRRMRRSDECADLFECLARTFGFSRLCLEKPASRVRPALGVGQAGLLGVAGVSAIAIGQQYAALGLGQARGRSRHPAFRDTCTSMCVAV